MTNFTIKKLESLKGIGYSAIHSTLLPELKRLNKSEIVCLIIMNYLHNFKDQNFSYYNIGVAFDIKYDTIKAGFEGLQEKNIITIEDNLVALNSKYFNEKNLVEKKIFESIVNNTKNSIGDRLEGLNKKMGEALKNGDTELALEINDEILLLSKSIKNPKSKKETATKEIAEETTKEADLEVKEQETITNTTTEIKAEKQAKTAKKETIIEEVEETTKEADLDDKKEIEHKDTSSIIQPLKQLKTFPKHEQTEDEMLEEYLNRLIEPTKVQILDIKKYIYQYFQTKDSKNLTDLEYQMRLYEKAQTDLDSHKSYDDRHGYDDDVDNYDEDGNLNLMDGGINL